MRLVALAMFAGMMIAPVATAQKLDLKFDAIAAKATDKAEVDLDAALLKLILPHVMSKDKDGKAASDFLSGVQEVHVRHYEFEKEGAYSSTDLDPLRRQVAGWSRIVNVHEKNESAEVFVLNQGGKIGGCLILATEARELSIVHIAGTFTLAQVQDMVDSKMAFNLGDLADLPWK